MFTLKEPLAPFFYTFKILNLCLAFFNKKDKKIKCFNDGYKI